mgnify:CR=1 FL=1
MNKLIPLLQSDQKLFHTQDLALILGISNRHNLRVTISRYIKKGILKPVYRGLYSTVPIQNIDKYKLGSFFIHKFCYVSLHSIFERHGVINQVVYGVSYISSISKRILFSDIQFIYKQMKPQFLLNLEGINLVDGTYEASLERAVADMIYFNPKFYFDSPNLINWNRVSEIKRIVGY